MDGKNVDQGFDSQANCIPYNISGTNTVKNKAFFSIKKRIEMRIEMINEVSYCDS